MKRQPDPWPHMLGVLIFVVGGVILHALTGCALTNHATAPPAPHNDCPVEVDPNWPFQVPLP